MTARRQTRTRSAAALLAIFAGSALSVSAFAANERGCDSVANSEMEVPTADVSVRTVDYPADTSSEITEALDISALDAEEIPALITLTPRVASVIDQMFAGQEEETLDAVPEAPASPVADSIPAQSGIPLPEAAPIGDTDEQELQVPGLQDQMYRKDI